MPELLLILALGLAGCALAVALALLTDDDDEPADDPTELIPLVGSHRLTACPCGQPERPARPADHQTAIVLVSRPDSPTVVLTAVGWDPDATVLMPATRPGGAPW